MMYHRHNRRRRIEREEVKREKYDQNTDSVVVSWYARLFFWLEHPVVFSQSVDLGSIALSHSFEQS